MSGFDQQRLVMALVFAVMALFVASNYPPVSRWRRPLRVAAILGFLVVLALVLAVIVLWAIGRQP